MEDDSATYDDGPFFALARWKMEMEIGGCCIILLSDSLLALLC
jgi:hypothetical protein